MPQLSNLLSYWVWLTFAFQAIAVALVWVLYCTESAVVIWFPKFYGTMNQILASPSNWFLWPLMAVIIIFPDFLFLRFVFLLIRLRAFLRLS